MKVDDNLSKWMKLDDAKDTIISKTSYHISIKKSVSRTPGQFVNDKANPATVENAILKPKLRAKPPKVKALNEEKEKNT